MVRETRHLWVGNLPENVSKERVKEYFNRYGPVQSVRPLPRREGRDGGTAVTVAFIDITAALKARQAEHKFDERILETDFYSPDSTQPGGGSTLSHTSEEKPVVQGAGINKLEQRSSHAYLRGPPGPAQDKFRGGRYHDDYRNRPARHQYRNQQPFNQETRNGVGGGVGSYRSNYSWKERVGRTDQYSDSNKLERNNKPVNGHSGSPTALLSRRTKKKRRKSRSSDSGSGSSGSGSGSRSSSSSSSRSSSSGSNSSKSRSPTRTSSSNTSKIKSNLGNYLPHTEFDKQCTIIVRNLPHRIEDGKLKDELHREYKRGGCSLRAVRIKTLPSSVRVAIITFSDPTDVSKALEDSRNKRIFGTLIEAEKLNSHHDESPANLGFRPRDSELNEFHVKATRTLHVGNISREVVLSQINQRFKEFGEILEIDIKKPDYSLVQFIDIKSVVRAIRAVDGELIAGQRVRLAFGPSVATKCVWCDGVGVDVTEKALQQEFAQFGKIQDLIIDRSRGHALVYFDQLKKATIAVTEMRGRTVSGSRLQTDYASHECRAAFFDHCKKTGMDVRERAKPWEQDQSLSAERRDGERTDRSGPEHSVDSRGSSVPRGSGRREERAAHRKGRDEYDEELRKFQSDRGKFDDSDRCFTPPHRRAPPPPSRSPSPPSRLARSPGAHSRSSGYDVRNEGRTFSDRDSVVSDGSRHGSPSRDSYRVGRYKPRTQAISPPASESRHSSPAHVEDYDRRGRRFRTLEGGESTEFRSSRIGSGDRTKERERPSDPRVIETDMEKKSSFKLAGVDSGLSEDTSSGSSGSVPDVDNAKLPVRVSAPPRRVSTDSAVSRTSHPGPDSRPPSPAHIPVYTGGPSLLRVMSTATEGESVGGFGAPRTPSSPPPDSDGSRPGTPLCDENPENLMCRPAAGPVRLSSHLRTSSTSEPMSLPLPMFAQDVLSTSPGDRRSSTERLFRPNQISPRDSTAAATKAGVRPDLAKLSIVSPTKYGGSSSASTRDPRLKSPSIKSPSLKSPSLPVSSSTGGYMKLRVSPSVPASSKTQSSVESPDPLTGSLMVKVNTPPEVKPKDPRIHTGLLTVAVPNAATASPASPSPKALVSQSSKPENKPTDKNLEDRIKSFKEQYEKWSGSVRVSGSGKTDSSGRFNIDIRQNQPSAIVQKLLSKRSVLDDDSKRLENLNEKKGDGSGEEKSEEMSPGSVSGAIRKPSGDGSLLNLELPGSPASGSTQFPVFSPLARDVPQLPCVSTVISTVPVNTSSCTRAVPLSTKPQPSTLADRSPISPPADPVSPRGSSHPNRLYFPSPIPPLPLVNPVEAHVRPPAEELTSRPLPLPHKAGTAATLATVPIKPLVDKLGKPAAFTKPSATVTPTLKSTGLTASTVRPLLSTTSSTKTVSTCTMVPTTKIPPQITLPAVEKGEASSTTCSPKLDTSIVSKPEIVTAVHETDSDPNVTSTTKDHSLDTKKKLESQISRDPLKGIKKEIDSHSFRDKKDIKEELLFAPTIIPSKPKLDKLSKRFDIIDSLHKDVKKSKESYSSLSKDKLKSSKDSQKHKQKLKHKNDLKDFLSATATIRKETSSKKEDKKSHDDHKKTTEESKEKKRRLSSNSEVEETEPKTKMAKLKQDYSDAEPDSKKHRTDSVSKLGRIPKLEKVEKPGKPEHKSETKKEESKKESKHKHSSSSSSKSKSRHETEKHRHKSERKEERSKDADKEKLKKKKSSKHDEEREKDKLRKHEKSKSLSISTDDEKLKKDKELKKTKDSKRKEERDKKEEKKEPEKRDLEKKDLEKKDLEKRDPLEKKDSSEKKDSLEKKDVDKRDPERERDREKRKEEKSSKEHKDKSRDKDRDKERSKDRERKERKRKKEEERKRELEMMAAAAKRKKMAEDGSSSEDGSDDDKSKFSIFDEPVFDPNNPIYFSMYDKVKARRSCVKAREEEEARKQQEALEKFSKLKAQRARKEEKRTPLDTTDDSMSEDGLKRSPSGDSLSLPMKKKPSLLASSSENEDVHHERRRKKKSSSGSDKKKSMSKKSMMDTSDESDSDIENSKAGSNVGNGLHRSKPTSTIYSSDDDSPIKTHQKVKKSFYSDSESNTESKTAAILKKKSISRDEGKTVSSHLSESESDFGEPKASALAVLAKGKKKSPVKDILDSKKCLKSGVKMEPLTSESEADTKPSTTIFADIKKEIKTEIKIEPIFNIKTENEKTPKKKAIKKEKKRDKEHKEKDKSVLGQKMAKIFGTSSEDESFGRNSKPPTPNTSSTKQATPLPKPVVPKLCVEQVFSASDTEKDKMDSPALMSDSDDDVRSRPPTPTFQKKKADDVKPVVPSEESSTSATASKPTETKTKESATHTLFDSSDDEMMTSPKEVKQDLERSRRLSAHERQKQSENLFDSLLTVNVDLPSKSSRKSPGGGLKSPASAKSPGLFSAKSPGLSSAKSPGLSSAKSPGQASAKSPGLASAKSPGVKSGSKPSEAQKSPGSHRSPLLSPGGKPIYLLAHTFNKSASRDEKRPKEPETIVTPKTEESPKEMVNATDENEVKTVTEETKPLLTIDEDRDSSRDSADIKIIEEVSNKAEDNDIIECAVLPKSSTKSDDADKAKKPDEKTSTELKRKPSTDKKAPPSKSEDKDTTYPEVQTLDAPSSTEPGYDVFAHGNLDATSSPSPASDYEEGRLVIGDGEDTNSDTDIVLEIPSKPVKAGDDPEIIVEHVTTPTTSSTADKVPKVPEPSQEEQLEKSIASITSEMETSEVTTIDEVTPEKPEEEPKAFEKAKEAVQEVEQPVKRTVISQEETESAVNALLGESFDSFDTEDPTVNSSNTVENMDVEAGTVDDEAASAVAGLGMDMSPPQVTTSPPRAWQARNDVAKQETGETPASISKPAMPSPVPVTKPAMSSPVVAPVSSLLPEKQPAVEQEKQDKEEKKNEDAVVSSDDVSVRGRGRGRGVQKRGRGAAVAANLPLLQTATTPVLRGRGRGARGARVSTVPEPVVEPVISNDGFEPLTPSTPLRGRGRGRVARGTVRGLKRFGATSIEDKTRDVFEFQESDEEVEKTEDSAKPYSSESSEEKKAEPEAAATPARMIPVRGRGRGAKSQISPTQPSQIQLNVSTPVTTPVTISTALSSPSIPVPSVQTPSPVTSSASLSALRLSTEERLSPSLSPGSGKSTRMRRSTGGKSRESEEESADTDHKIKLILEQAKQEAAQQAAAHQLVSMPGFSIPGGIPISAVTQGPLMSPQSVMQVVGSPTLDPRTGAQSISAVRTGIPQPTVLPPRHDQQVRPQRTSAPVRAQTTVATVVSGPRPTIPIQLPTQPLPPETVRKTQPVLLEQNQPTSAKISPNVTRTTLAVTLPTEPVPRSLALPAGTAVTNVQRMPIVSTTISGMARMAISNPATSLTRMPSVVPVTSMIRMSIASPVATVTRMTIAGTAGLPRMTLPSPVTSLARMPTSSAVMVNARAPAPVVHNLSTVVRPAAPPSAVRPGAPPGPRAPTTLTRPPTVQTRPPTQVPEGQRVSLKQREDVKEPELDQKTREQIALDALMSSQQQQHPKREFLQPREQEVHRPASTPVSLSDANKDEEKPVFGAHQQPYDAQTMELYNIRNYRDFTILYNQLISAGHPDNVAIQYAQTVLRERLLEESRPGSVPPLPHIHHHEEERRQPLPAHSTGPYRQTDSPMFHLPPAHSGNQHPFLPREPVGPPAAHMDPYRRDELVPPAAHSSQIKRLTHSSVSDFSKAASTAPHPGYPESSEQTRIPNYSMPHLAAYPIYWSGILGLKENVANVQMHYVSGSRDLARAYLPMHGSKLKIEQRMRLEDTQIDGVKKKMDTKSEHCMLLALPHGGDLDEIEKQSKILRNNFITYLQLKSAAGIVNVLNEENQPAIVHVFPSCDFANENLARIAPNLLHRVADIEHLVIIIATVFNDANK